MLVMLASAHATQVVSGFSPTPTQVRTPITHMHSTTAATTSEEVVLKTKVPVARISVCAGELCQCQGEEFEYTGGASDAVIKELKQLGLPFPIEDVGCLGACGMGTMIAIDFENGDSIMTDGLESTYSELGILGKTQSLTNASAQSSDNGAKSSAVFDATKAPITPQKAPSSKELVDVRERMRQEAANVEVENPWLKMASYLVQKATDKVFGSD